MDPEKVWNVEFEVHREYLKGFSCEETGETGIFDTMDFLLRLDGLSLLWTHLTNKYSHSSAFWGIVRAGDVNRFVDCGQHVFRFKDIDATKEREVAQIRGRLMKLILNQDLPDDSDPMNEALKVFVSMVHEYEDDNDKSFDDDVLRKRREYMDTEMLKMRMAEKRKSSDKLLLLNELLTKKRLQNADTIMDKENAQ
ncbi:Uncharacterised protein [Mycobacteroides abscessus subsp. massiliense]|nr:Uncharacterised protein [Mycobacteroides abscessus subsp. massiliense]